MATAAPAKPRPTAFDTLVKRFPQAARLRGDPTIDPGRVDYIMACFRTLRTCEHKRTKLLINIQQGHEASKYYHAYYERRCPSIEADLVWLIENA